MRTLIGIAAAFAVLGVTAATATTLAGDNTADNSFNAYLSTNDNVLGTQINFGIDCKQLIASAARRSRTM